MAMQSSRLDPRPPRLAGVGNAVIRMPAANARGLALSGTILALTGIALGLMRYLVAGDDAFSAYPSPWWKPVMIVHVMATPVFFFFVGSIWWRHVVRHWKTRERRLSGAVVVVIMALVAASGYALYFTGAERLLDLTRALHAGSGVLATAVYAHHAVLGWRAVAARRAAAERATRGTDCD